MVDIKFIRDNKDKVKEAIKNKGITLDLDELLSVDSKRIELQLVDRTTARIQE